MFISPTAIITLAVIILIIIFSFTSYSKSQQEPFIVYFTQKLIIVSASLLILTFIWFALFSVFAEVSLYAVLFGGALLTLVLLYFLICNWKRFEESISKFVKYVYHRNERKI
ncbi:hypothetical protein QD47_21770 [Paenibacillus terrae]|uniref:Uncharacterized protein n=1 Tax=Paenibacillus terrae TaxID=159743 RepID=A0A0D7WWS3_9BACL|nr:hypothetical protein QD47_21770 [Paenibacillus terrae]